MVSGGMTCVKYLLFCFNLLFAISGIAILTIGSVILISYNHYSAFVYASYQSAPIVLIIVGVVVFIIAFFGCCGAVKENHCMIITFSVLLLIVFSMELATGIAGYIRRSDVETMLKSTANTTMYACATDHRMEETWDVVQHELHCCGMNGPADWNLVFHNNTLPHTCCPDTPDDGSCTIDSKNIYTDSCVLKLKEKFIKYGSIIGGVGVGIAFSQIIGVLFACCLAHSIRKQYETV